MSCESWSNTKHSRFCWEALTFLVKPVDSRQLLWTPTRENCWSAAQRSLHFFHFLRIVFGQVSVDVSGPAKFRCPKSSKGKSRDKSVWKQGKPFTSSRSTPSYGPGPALMMVLFHCCADVLRDECLPLCVFYKWREKGLSGAALLAPLAFGSAGRPFWRNDLALWPDAGHCCQQSQSWLCSFIV